MATLGRRVAAEAAGTFGFVFIGTGVVVANAMTGAGFGLLGIALAHALALGIMVSATMNISGGHLNPAVTVGLLATGRIGAKDAGAYLAAQLLAALAAAWLVSQLLPADLVRDTKLGTPLIQGSTTFSQAILLEAVLTFLLMSAVMGTAVVKTAPAIGGFGIGLTLLFDILVGGPMTGAAMNPARAFGPAIVSGNTLGQAAYWIGPILGSLAAAFLWHWLAGETEA